MHFRFCDLCGFSSIWKDLPNNPVAAPDKTILKQCGHCLRKRKEMPHHEDVAQPLGKEAAFQNDVDDLFADNFK